MFRLRDLSTLRAQLDVSVNVLGFISKLKSKRKLRKLAEAAEEEEEEAEAAALAKSEGPTLGDLAVTLKRGAAE